MPPAVFSRGPGTLSIDRGAFHGPIRADVVRRFQLLRPRAPTAPAADNDADDAPNNQKQRPGPRLLLVKGGDVLPVYDTDGEILLRQEAFFHHLFGVEEEGFLGALNLDDGTTALFAPRLPDAYAVWFGSLHPPSHYCDLYGVDECVYKDELKGWLSSKSPSELHVLAGKNTDSGADAAALAPSDAAELAPEGCALMRGGAAFEALVEARVHKTPGEVEVIEYVNVAASRAHVSLMRECARRAAAAANANANANEKSISNNPEEGEGEEEVMREFQLEALFQYETYSRSGCRFQGYTPIVASGGNAAILHYGHSGAPNDGPVLRKDLVLVDAGCEYYRYTSDITCTWPASGKFTADQRLVYEAVLGAHKAVINGARPGVSWLEMHALAYREILTALTNGGLLRGDVDAMLEAEVGGLFMPHGLGHFLGLSTHDVGGYDGGASGGSGEGGGGGGEEGAAPPPPQKWPSRVDRPGFRSLRTARLLEPGMVITVEPGCYFSFEALLDPVLKEEEEEEQGGGEGEGDDAAAAAARALRRRQRTFFVLPGPIERFRGFGGVRLEDNVLITADGCRSLTDVPRSVEDVERVMAGGQWP